jgi:hypothetical protein
MKNKPRGQFRTFKQTLTELGMNDFEFVNKVLLEGSIQPYYKTGEEAVASAFFEQHIDELLDSIDRKKRQNKHFIHSMILSNRGHQNTSVENLEEQVKQSQEQRRQVEEYGWKKYPSLQLDEIDNFIMKIRNLFVFNIKHINSYLHSLPPDVKEFLNDCSVYTELNEFYIAIINTPLMGDTKIIEQRKKVAMELFEKKEINLKHLVKRQYLDDKNLYDYDNMGQQRKRYVIGLLLQHIIRDKYEITYGNYSSYYKHLNKS